MLQDNAGNWISNEGQLKLMASKFFKCLYYKDTFSSCIFKTRGRFLMISPGMFIALGRPVTKEDIHAALFDMKPLKALGPDGLHAIFCQHY